PIITAALLDRGNSRRENSSRTLPVSFVTEKEKSPVLYDRTANRAAELILSVWRGVILSARLYFPGLQEAIVGVQDLGTQIFVSLAMPRIASRFGAEIDDSTGEFAPFRPQVAVLHLEFPNGILGRHQHRQIDVPDIQGLAIQILGTLIRKGSPN